MSSLGAQEMMIAQWMQCWPTLQLEKVVKALSFAWERGTLSLSLILYLKSDLLSKQSVCPNWISPDTASGLELLQLQPEHAGIENSVIRSLGQWNSSGFLSVPVYTSAQFSPMIGSLFPQGQCCAHCLAQHLYPQFMLDTTLWIIKHEDA